MQAADVIVLALDQAAADRMRENGLHMNLVAIEFDTA